MHGIPTLYSGIQFRSRLEATWAAFFTMVGWRYEYEPFDCRGWIPDFLVQDLLRQEKLVRVLEEVEPVPWDLYIYRPQRGPVPQRIRLVFDHLLSRLSDR